jgi:hypothetical protein
MLPAAAPPTTAVATHDESMPTQMTSSKIRLSMIKNSYLNYLALPLTKYAMSRQSSVIRR